jgi:hypothetical protein
MKIRTKRIDPGLRIESFAVINLRGVFTNKILYVLSPCKPTKNLIKNYFTFQSKTPVKALAQLPRSASTTQYRGLKFTKIRFQFPSVLRLIWNLRNTLKIGVCYISKNTLLFVKLPTKTYGNGRDYAYNSGIKKHLAKC